VDGVALACVIASTGHTVGPVDLTDTFNPGYDLEGEAVVKKIVIAAVAAAGSALALLKLKNSKSEQKLWAEATDSVPPTPAPGTPPSES
jgi:hypothetical protein